MKQLLVLLASVMLGVLICDLILGPDNSITSGLREAWTKEIDYRTLYQEPALEN